MDHFLTLNEFFRKHFGQRVQKIPLDAGLGCPNRILGKGGCIYCNEKGSGTGASLKKIPLKKQLLDGMEWARRRYKARLFAAYFQAFSNTFAPLDMLEELYLQITDIPEIVAVAIGTRPDCVDGQVLDLIARCFPDKMVWMEYGLQSASDRTLQAINRGHTVDDFVRAVEITREYPFLICAHVIFGLPGEEVREMKDTIGLVRSLGIDGIKFHELYVIKGTPLWRMYKQGLYTPMDQDRYAKMVAWAIRTLPKDTVVQRLTGDPAPGELEAPDWAGRKQETICLIKKYFEQGDLAERDW